MALGPEAAHRCRRGRPKPDTLIIQRIFDLGALENIVDGALRLANVVAQDRTIVVHAVCSRASSAARRTTIRETTRNSTGIDVGFGSVRALRSGCELDNA